MEEGEDTNPAAADDADDAADASADLPSSDVVEAPLRTSFLEYLKSPIVELVVGDDDGAGAYTLRAHRYVLTRSPWFERAVKTDPRNADGELSIKLKDDDVEAVGPVIEYLYMGDYFPKIVEEDSAGKGILEQHPSIPGVDNDGDYLLKHARIYTLAEKLNLPELQSLAHKKVHATVSTARGEINYARYIYQHTKPNDQIRNPVAAFWATRSHILRHEAEEEFRAMCLEFPQFGFDVLSKVLDQKEKRQGGGAQSTATPSVAVDTPGRGRKRARVSGV